MSKYTRLHNGDKIIDVKGLEFIESGSKILFKFKKGTNVTNTTQWYFIVKGPFDSEEDFISYIRDNQQSKYLKIKILDDMFKEDI